MAQTTTAPAHDRQTETEGLGWEPVVGNPRYLRLGIAAFVGHIVALVFGLAGILIALPNPELWADTEFGPRAFDFGMTYGGSLHIVFATAAMFLYGITAIGLAKTSIFFLASVPISLAAELIGTNLGFPFGNYEYTSFLGYQVLGDVPFSIPLSWFYLGFATYLLGHALALQFNLRPIGVYAVVFGAIMLTAWDLVLDPAMAHEDLSIQFWIWEGGGAYFGMPLQNFFGWALTAVVFMAVARLLWRSDPPNRGVIRWLWFPYAIYVANIFFAAVLAADVGLWWTILLAVVFGLVPATIALIPWARQRRSSPDTA